VYVSGDGDVIDRLNCWNSDLDVVREKVERLNAERPADDVGRWAVFKRTVTETLERAS
jgi:hypothetical protein